VNEDILVPLGIFLIVTSGIVLFPIARALARRLDRQSLAPSAPSGLTERLHHMEQAIDAIAVEVERISEGQRFTTKLLSDRQQSLPPRQP